MTPEQYTEFKMRTIDKIRDMLGDAMQDIEDYALDELTTAGLISIDYTDDECEKADNWIGHIIKNIVREWSDPDIDPFIHI